MEIASAHVNQLFLFTGETPVLRKPASRLFYGNRRDTCSTEIGETPVLRKSARRLFYGNRRDACSTETGETPVLRKPAID
ncbi:MAG: hypothetical protein SXA11_04630 [Cyanobacteriota bacterium]|nr:hypothetical protein [Cyanobacteriota bacterium]